MKKVHLILLVVLLLSINDLPCFASTAPHNPRDFTLEISGGNNLFPLDVTLKTLKNELPMELDIPADFLYQGGLFLSLPIIQRESTFLGIFYRQAGFIYVTGETLRFYRCYVNPQFPHKNKYYDLASDYLDYALFGSYIGKEWKQGAFRGSLGGELFACFDYEKLTMQGQGWVGGAKNYGIYGNYRREWSSPEDPWAWGLAVIGDFFYQRNGFSLHLNLRNLPAWLYFPQLKQENGLVDTEQDSIGPLPINGFKAKGSEFRSLPTTALLQAAYRVESSGIFFGTVVYNGCTQDISLGYRQPWGELGLIVMVNPVYWNYGFGLDWKYVALLLAFGIERPDTWRGASLRLQF